MLPKMLKNLRFWFKRVSLIKTSHSIDSLKNAQRGEILVDCASLLSSSLLFGETDSS